MSEDSWSMIRSIPVCDERTGEQEPDVRTHWEQRVSGAHSAVEGHSEAGPYGGIVPPHMKEAIRRHKEGKNDASETDERSADRSLHEVDGGAGSGSDPHEEGSASASAGRGIDSDALHGERRASTSESDRTTEEG